MLTKKTLPFYPSLFQYSRIFFDDLIEIWLESQPHFAWVTCEEIIVRISKYRDRPKVVSNPIVAPQWQNKSLRLSLESRFSRDESLGTYRSSCE